MAFRLYFGYICGNLFVFYLLSVPERALICFRLSFLAAAAALWSPLNISFIIRRFQTIFGSYIPYTWENFSACLNLTFDLYEGHMIENNFFEVHPPSSQFRKNYLLHSLII